MQKLFALILVVTVSMGVLFWPGEVQVAASQEAAVFTPGTYTGTGFGRNGLMTVETTFDENSIVSIEIVSHFESPGVWPILDVVPNAIVEHQSLSVDFVAGATMASFGIILAVTEALEEAGGNPQDFRTPIERPEESAQTFEADVIIVGAGGAGLAAGVSAHQQGASVIIVERLGYAGGSTVFSGGAFNAANPVAQAEITMTASNIASIEALLDDEPHDEFEAELQAIVREQFDAHMAGDYAEGLFDSMELHMLQTHTAADRVPVPSLVRVFAEGALESIDWLSELGAEWSPVIGAATGSLWRRSHYGTADFPEGTHSVWPFVTYVDNNEGIEIHFNTNATELIVEDGRVVGILATTRRGTEMTYLASGGVIMATGGFGANVAMREEYNEQWAYLGPGIGTSNQVPSAQGDGIIMGQAVGAQLKHMGMVQLHPNGVPGSGDMMARPTTAGLNRIFVNNYGSRFIAEDARRDDTINAIMAAPGGSFWVVADSTRFPDDGSLEFIGLMNQVALGFSVMADSVEELAELMGVDADNLQASIDQYNAIVDGEEDPFGLVTFDRHMGNNPPFFAAERVPTVHHTMGGLLIDVYARVLDYYDNPIPGFFAAGEVTGGIHGTNRLGGNALTDIVVFGRIAGESAAAER